MAWVRLIPRPGRRLQSGGVTVAYATRTSRTQPGLRIYIAHDVCDEMLWQDTPTITVDHDPPGNRLRLSVGKVGWKLSRSKSTGCLSVPLDGLSLPERRPAERVAHQFEDGDALLLTLPEWARTVPAPRVGIMERKIA